MHPLYNQIIEKLKPRDVRLDLIEIELELPKRCLSKAVRGHVQLPAKHIEKLIKHLKIK
jgi:hypothetical protein